MKREYDFSSYVGGWRNYTVLVQEALFENNALAVMTQKNHDGMGKEGTLAYLRKDDAIDLAWSILEHYKVTERPPAPLTVGDFVVTNGGHVGRIVDIDVDEPALYVEGLDTSPSWEYTHDTHRITKEEFVEKSLAKAAEDINTFVGEG